MVLAESAHELQQALNAVYEYCDTWHLSVNTDKTKVVIFSKGKVRNIPQFFFGNNNVDVVDDYTYLGVVFNYNGKFHKAIAKQVLQGKKAFYSLLNKVYNLNLPFDISLELFDQLVLPVLMYGCEVWGFSDITTIEVLHRKFIKKLLGLKSHCPNVMVYGESGTLPISHHLKARMVNFYMRLVNGKHSKLSYIMYRLLRTKHSQQPHYESVWVSCIANIFSNLGMNDIWEFEGHGFSSDYVKQAVKLRIRDISIQELSSDMADHYFCDFYRHIKPNFGREVLVYSLI